MPKNKLTEEKVFSPIEDKQIRQRINLSSSIIWGTCFKPDEVADFETGYTKMFCYTIKFDGLTPVQLVNIERIR